MDTSKKWEQLIAQDEKEEAAEKEQSRYESRDRYEKNQREKQLKWEDKMRREGKDPEVEKQKFGHSNCGFSHMSSLMNQSNNTHENCNHTEKNSKEPSHCGYMTKAQILQMQNKKKSTPVLTTAQKNIKKKSAVYAAKEDANRLFKESKYDIAYQVYERGILIINGMYDLSDEEYEEMEKIEAILNLNIAAIKLKQKQWTEVISYCRMCMQMDDKNPKIFYRWAEALIGMGEYMDAKVQTLKAKELMPESKAIDGQLQRIEKLYVEQMNKCRRERKKISKRMQNKNFSK